MKIHDCKQGSTEWGMLRAGRPTASEFDNLITPEWKPRAGQTPESYLYRKLAERCMGIPLQGGSSFAMEQGSLLELEAIPYYDFTYSTQIQRVGFCTTDDGKIGCSPDGLIGDDGGIECKCPQPETHLKYLLGGVVPKEYLAQVHGSMYVTGRPWWIFLSYSRQFPPLVIRVERDMEIDRKIDAALKSFLELFDSKMAVINSIRDSDNAVKEAQYANSSR